MFGFGGDESARPFPTRVEQSPADTASHFIDYDDRYHIREQVERTKANVYTYGYAVQTRAPGRYPIVIEAITDYGNGKPANKLILKVETRGHGAS